MQPVIPMKEKKMSKIQFDTATLVDITFEAKQVTFEELKQTQNENQLILMNGGLYLFNDGLKLLNLVTHRVEEPDPFTTCYILTPQEEDEGDDGDDDGERQAA